MLGQDRRSTTPASSPAPQTGSDSELGRTDGSVHDTPTSTSATRLGNQSTQTTNNQEQQEGLVQQQHQGGVEVWPGCPVEAGTLADCTRPEPPPQSVIDDSNETPLGIGEKEATPGGADNSGAPARAAGSPPSGSHPYPPMGTVLAGKGQQRYRRLCLKRGRFYRILGMILLRITHRFNFKLFKIQIVRHKHTHTRTHTHPHTHTHTHTTPTPRSTPTHSHTRTHTHTHTHSTHTAHTHHTAC